MLPEKIYNYIKKEKLFNKDDKILLALSGGCDSVALFRVFTELKVNFAVAHCNFKLRGKDSDNDEKFVKELAELHGIKIFTVSFNTREFARKNKLSLEDAARKLRYEWFEKIRTENNFSYIATAHHLNDNIETFFINFIKGTGIKGLRGMLPANGKIIRPMLSVTRNEIINFCNKNKIKFRQDKSNFDNYFLRNKLRNNILPLFEEINPQFENALRKNLDILRDIEKIYDNYINKEIKVLKKTENNSIYIDIERLLNTEAYKTVLFEILRPYGFNSSQTEEITNNINKIQTGKTFSSKTHILLKTDNNLIIKKKDNNKLHITIKNIEEISDFKNGYINSEILDIKEIKTYKTDKNTILVDYDKIKFPLILRTYEKGDYFYPFGMKGRKLLSDFFTDAKINRFEREKILILTTEKNEIIWITGYRFDDRFKITEKTQKVLQIKRL